jgi:hypothetical protein
MDVVIRCIQDVERLYDVVFDVDDPDLWESLDGGYRIWGMLKETINGYEHDRVPVMG